MTLKLPLNSFLHFYLISKMLMFVKRGNLYLCRTCDWCVFTIAWWLWKSREQNENLKQAKITLMVAKNSYAFSEPMQNGDPPGKKKDNLIPGSDAVLHMSWIEGIEWFLRAFASMRAVRLFLRGRGITNGEQRALRKDSARWNLS